MWKLDEDEEDDLDSPNIHKELKKNFPLGWMTSGGGVFH